MSPLLDRSWDFPPYDIDAYDPDDVKNPEYVDRILDGGDDER